MGDLNELPEKVQKPKEAADIIKNTNKFFAQKGKVSYLWHIIRAKFSNASKRRESLHRW